MTDNLGGQDDLDYDPAFEGGTEDDRLSRRRNRRLWFWFVVIAFVIFEATANPSLAVAFGCIKFGWHDFLRALQLKRDDPSRVRGKVCARFSTAWGLTKISLVATVLMFAITNVEMRVEAQEGKPMAGPNKQPPGTFMTAVFVVFVGMGASACVSGFAVVSALRHGLKVWVGSRVNRAKLVLAGAILTWVTAITLVVTLVALATLPKAGLTPVQLHLMSFTLLLGIPVSILVLLEALQRRIVAQTPTDCWGQLPSDLLKATGLNDWESLESR